MERNERDHRHMEDKQSKTLGVIGGMGPAASLLFYSMIIDHTAAYSDQQHIDMIILNHASMPERTKALQEGGRDGLLSKLIRDAQMLEKCGADGFVITCNTSHALADEIQSAVNIPLLNIVTVAVEECADRHRRGKKRAPENRDVKIAVLATKGAIGAEIYQKEMERRDISVYIPTPQSQQLVHKIIYDDVKGGGALSLSGFKPVEDELISAGCDGAIMGCTELSVFKEHFKLPEFYLDPMMSLAKRAIEFAGREFK
ncbi:MAG: amino acid racemase [Peptococcaceae bacterium]|jgi:aspartate racemase|nr:amino acid racemase [Peptococcaceae bacterium]